MSSERSGNVNAFRGSSSSWNWGSVDRSVSNYWLQDSISYVHIVKLTLQCTHISFIFVLELAKDHVFSIFACYPDTGTKSNLIICRFCYQHIHRKSSFDVIIWSILAQDYQFHWADWAILIRNQNNELPTWFRKLPMHH